MRRERRLSSQRKFLAFVSHHKRDCATEARFIKDRLEPLLLNGQNNGEVFLDSDDLVDLRLLLTNVKNSEVLVVVLSSDVIFRPWCILEIFTAAKARIPIISLCVKGKGYDYSSTQHQLTFLDRELDRINPGASDILRQHGVEPIDAAYILSSVLPHIISIELNTAASKAVLAASLGDVAEQIKTAEPLTISTTKEEWLASRESLPMSLSEHGKAQETPKAKRIEALLAVPELPRGYIPRASIFNKIKESLLAESSLAPRRDHACSSGISGPVITVHGMGGSGKTVMAVAIANDVEIRTHFSKVCFLIIGQEPNIRDLQRNLYFQLCNRQLDPSIIEDMACFHALQEAAKEVTALLVIDDAWYISHVTTLKCIDPNTASRVLVTSRVRGLVPDVPEFLVEALDIDDAVSLMLRVAGRPAAPPFQPIEHAAAQACSRLPLLLSVAGSMLEQFGGTVTEDFVAMLHEDHGEVLREGEYGDMHVKVEDRIITNSLRQYQGHDRDGVLRLFNGFAIFPEDVHVPAAFFDLIAVSVFGVVGKRPQMQIRSCLKALMSLSLVQGSLDAGVYQHDIVRDFARSRSKDLQALHNAVVETLISTRPFGVSWPSVDAVARGTLEWYVATHSSWHIRATFKDSIDGDALLERLAVSDETLAEAMATGVGQQPIIAAADKAIASGRFKVASELLFAASLPAHHGLLSVQAEYDLLCRASGLLRDELDSDIEANELELRIVGRLCFVAFGNNEGAVVERMQELNARKQKRVGDTFENALEDGHATVHSFLGILHAFDGPITQKITSDDLDAVAATIVKSCRRTFDASKLAKTFDEERFARSLGWAWCSLLWPMLGRRLLESGIVDELGGVESLIECLRKYDMRQDHRFHKKLLHKVDMFLSGFVTQQILLTHGRMEEANLWLQKLSATMQEITDATMSTQFHANYSAEVMNMCMTNAALLQLLGMRAEARSLMEASGLNVWDSKMLSLWLEGFNPALLAGLGGLGSVQCVVNLLTFLVFGNEAVETAVVRELLNDAQRLVTYNNCYFQLCMSVFNVLGLAAQVAERLGDDAASSRFCEIALEHFRGCNPITCASMHALKGRILARSGVREEALRSWRSGFNLAMEERLPLYALRIGIDCGGAEGDHMIDSACDAMGQPRTSFKYILGGTDMPSL
jgi:hypothetical protein